MDKDFQAQVKAMADEMTKKGQMDKTADQVVLDLKLLSKKTLREAFDRSVSSPQNKLDLYDNAHDLATHAVMN